MAFSVSNFWRRFLWSIAVFIAFNLEFAAQENYEIENITEDEGLISNYIFGIVQDQNGFYWIASDRGLAKYHDGKWHVTDADSGLPGNYINQICADHKRGLILYFSEKGLYYFNTQKGKVDYRYNVPIKENVQLRNSDTNPNYIVVYIDESRSFAIDRNKPHQQIPIVHVKNERGPGKFVHAKNYSSTISTDKILLFPIYSIGENSYEAVSGKGIVVRKNGKITQIIKENEGLGNTFFTGVYKTAENDLFFPTLGGGLSVIRNFNSQQSIQLESSVIRDLQYKNGKYFILADGFVKIVGADWKLTKTFVGQDALSMYVKDHNLYVGSLSDIKKFKLNNSLLTLVETVEVKPGVSRIFENGGKLYFSTYGKGIYQYPDLHLDKKFPFGIIENIYSIKNGYAAVSYENGFFRTDNNFSLKEFHNIKSGLKSNFVSHVFNDDDTLWVGSKKSISGFVNGKIVKHFEEGSGFTGNSVRNIFRDRSGIIWVVSDHMVMTRKRDRLIPNGSLNLFWNQKDAIIRSIYDAQSNSIINLSKNRLSTIDLSKIKPRQSPEIPKLLKIIADGKELPLNHKIELAHDHQELKILFNTVDWDILSSAELMFQINNGNWTPFSDPEKLIFKKLNEGLYNIKVKTVNSDGYETAYPHIFTIKVSPIFYKQWWFYVLSLLLSFALAGFIFYDFSMTKIKQKTEEIKLKSHLENERKRISRDLHDNIGAYTTSLISKLDNLSGNSPKPSAQLSEIKEDASFILNLLRQTIWVLETKSSPLINYVDSFRNYIDKYLNAYPHIKYEISEEIDDPDKMFDSTKMISLFRIIQEALQNIVKHAEATEVKITIVSHNNVVVTIKDNGRGFNPDEKSSGYGLVNMRVRAEEAGFDIQINSGINGTEIMLKEK